MPEPNKKNSFLKKLSRSTLGLLIFLICIYLTLGLVFDRDFFARDASEKYGRVLGVTTLSIRVIGPPGQPVPSAEARCTYLGAPFVRLTWTATSDTDDYSVERDVAPLVNGLTETTHDDYAVASATTYSYVVIASGPVAPDTPSLPVVVTTNLCSALPDPTVSITTLDILNLIGYVGTPQTTVPNPLISGTTNIIDAEIDVTLAGPSPFVASTTANGGGFWSWQPLVNLTPGAYVLTITATDPLEPTRFQSASIAFDILAMPDSGDDDDDDDEEDDNKKKHRVTPPIQTPGTPSIQAPPEINTNFALTLEVLNDDDIVFSGQDLKTRLTVQAQDPAFNQNQTVDYLIVDSNGKVFFQTSSETTVFRESLVYQNITLPRLLKNGRYKIVAQTNNNGVLVSAESFFRLQEAPLIVAGPVKLTFTELMANLGWVIAILSFLLLIFLFLLSIEYWLYKHSLVHIDEHFLQQKGFLGKRKEVLR